MIGRSSHVRRVLLLDAHVMGRVARMLVMESHGYRVEVADDEAAGLELLAAGAFDVTVIVQGRESRRVMDRLRVDVPIAIVVISEVDYCAIDLSQANAVVIKGANEITELLRALDRQNRQRAAVSRRPFQMERATLQTSAKRRAIA